MLLRTARSLVLVAFAVSVLLWVTVGCAPGLLDRAGAWLRERETAHHLRQFQSVESAVAAGDLEAAADLIEDWSAQLAGARKLDALAPVSRWVARRASEIHAMSGRRDLALAHAQRAVAFDDRDVDAVARLGILLMHEPGGSKAAVELLEPMWERLPQLASLAIPLARALIDRGELGKGARVIVRLAGAVPAEIWHVQWSPRPVDVSWFLWRALGEDQVEARFSIEPQFRQLRLRLPPFAAVELRDCRLLIASADSVREHEVMALRPELTGLREANGVLVAPGLHEQGLSVDLGAPVQAGSVVTLRARRHARISDELRDALLGELGDQLLARLPADDALRDPLCSAWARALLVGGFSIRCGDETCPLAFTATGPGGSFRFDGQLAPDCRTLTVVVPALEVFRRRGATIEVQGESGRLLARIPDAGSAAETTIEVSQRSSDRIRLVLRRGGS